MSWVDKELRKNRLHKQVDQVLNSPQYKKEIQKEYDKRGREAINGFMLISVDFLHRELGFGQKRICNFLRFALSQMEAVTKLRSEGYDYYRDLNEQIKKEIGVDILGELEEKNYE